MPCRRASPTRRSAAGRRTRARARTSTRSTPAPRRTWARARPVHGVLVELVAADSIAPMRACRSFLESLDLPPGDLHALPESPKRFADGARYRVEIPSCEGPRCLEALLEAAERLDVRVHRASQGSGVFMLTDAELAEMAAMARDGDRRDQPLRAAERRLGHLGHGAQPRGRRGRGGLARAGADRAGPRRCAPRRRGRRAQRPDRRRRPARRVRRGAPQRLPAGGHAGQDLGDAARLQPGHGARARARSARTRSTSRPTSRSRRSRRSARSSTCRSTSTSRCPTTSAASCGCTRFPRSCASRRRSTSSSACATRPTCTPRARTSRRRPSR